MSLFYQSQQPSAPRAARTTDADAELARAQRAAQRGQRLDSLAAETVVDPRRARALPPRQSQQQQQQQAMRASASSSSAAIDTYIDYDDFGPRSSNLLRLALMRNAEALRVADDAARRTSGPRFAAVRAPHRPQGPRPHLYGSLHEDPLPLLGPRSGALQAYMERLRAEEATLGGAALVPAPMAERIQALVASSSTHAPTIWRAAR